MEALSFKAEELKKVYGSRAVVKDVRNTGLPMFLICSQNKA